MKLEKIVVAVIGLGMGAHHLRGAINCGCEVGLICDIKPERLKEIGEELNIPEEKRTTDWHDILTDKEINAVIIATPDQLHCEMVVACLDAGKNVMCEKPLALIRPDLDKIVAAVEAHPESKFMIGQICRFTPAFVKAKEYIDSGRIGEIYFVESEYAHDYLHMYEADPNHWRLDPDRHGVVGGGCHAVDLLRWLTGRDPYEVYAYGTHKLLPMLPYDDATVAIMKFPDNIMGKVFCSTGCKRNYTMRTLVYGTKGTLIFDNKSETMQVFECDETGHGGHDPVDIPVEVNNHNADAEIAAFAKSLLEDIPVEMTVYEGAKTVVACHAIVESSVSGKIVNPDYNLG
ncbi:MAG: Gfo/Idh/MocA family oxidoreductase [Clostridia bacterium]|nr:Gfo/Idh/MocA family oxidoreductase [Clostridia bacterium]